MRLKPAPERVTAAAASGTRAATPAACGQFQRTVELIGRRWSGAILYQMFGGASRFSDIRDGVPGLSDRLLCERLRELEAWGLVAREVIPAVPVQVRYTLSESAHELRPALQMLADWSRTWLGPAPGLTSHTVPAPHRADRAPGRRIRQVAP